MKQITKQALSIVLVFALLCSFAIPVLAYQQVGNGSQGNDVKTMQKMLNTVMNAGLTVDGICGAKSVAAIKNFQKAYGLSADGICGKNTWAKLEVEYNKKVNATSEKCTNHKKGSFSHADTAHPHKQYYKCSNCGVTFTDGSTTKMSSCKTCNPPVQSSTSYSTVRNGSQGNDVKTMQKMLNTVMNAELSVDGICGAKSVDAIKKFQKAYGLSADGICGPKTWEKLEAEYNKKGNTPPEKCENHKKGSFSHSDAAHPHKQYYKCSNCGVTFTDGSTTKMSSCKTCNPPVQSSTSYSTVRNGSQGNDVKTMQKMLNTVMNAELSVDGICGAKSVAAIKNFQKAYGLSADGICGSKTWEKLEEAYNNGKTIKPVASSIKIGSGNYSPETLKRGQTYSVSGRITSTYRLTNVTVGIYNVDGSKTNSVKTVSPNTTTYDIKNIDSYIKFGTLDGTETGKEYYFKVSATDSNGVSKTLVNKKFKVIKKNCKYSWPLPGNTTITSYFGGRIHPLTGKPNNHSGIDISAGKGTKVYAAESGTVYVMCKICQHNYGKSKSCGCGGGYGNYIYILHDDGLRTYYAHLTDILVADKSHVSKGDVIGTVGSTGSSSGNHLHFEMRTGSSRDSRVDPLNYTEPY